MSAEIRKFDKDSTLPKEVADQIIRIFTGNYPSSHSPEIREKDMAERADQTALNALLLRGRVIFTVQDVRKKVLGLLEMDEVDQGQGVYMQLVWLMVDALERGQGIAGQLHQAFVAEARERAGRAQKPSCLWLAVHPDNPAKKVYEKWGYAADERTSKDGRAFMFKNL